MDLWDGGGAADGHLVLLLLLGKPLATTVLGRDVLRAKEHQDWLFHWAKF